MTNLSQTTILDGLNEAQKQAVLTTDGPLLVVAGPGTGKTLTMVRKIAYLIGSGVAPDKILAVTFTNRAARELQERAGALLGADVGQAFVGTFHLLGLRILRELGRDVAEIYTRDDQVEVLKSLLKISARDARRTAENISRAKNFLTGVAVDLQPVLESYQATLRERNVVDFDDLIALPVELLESGAGDGAWRERFSHIIIDEYQDINPAQYRLMRLLAGATDHLCVVGDADQAIYSFRGADPGNFLNFERDFPGATRITLTDNYRSTSVILHAADTVISNNRQRISKELAPTRDLGAPITLFETVDEKAEGEAVINELEARMGGTSHYRMAQNGPGRDQAGAARRFSDFAILYRTNGQAKALEEAFRASGIPYQVAGRGSAAQVNELNETVAYLRSFLPSTEGDAAPHEGTVESKLLSPIDLFDPRADAVTLMTMHTAKGLEFRTVFITGCEEGLAPCTIMQDNVDLEEERRLFFVAMTRARDELILLSAGRRFLYGRRLAEGPSPFLDEIPDELLEKVVVAEKAGKRKEPDQQLGLFGN